MYAAIGPDKELVTSTTEQHLKKSMGPASDGRIETRPPHRLKDGTGSELGKLPSPLMRLALVDKCRNTLMKKIAI